MKTNLWIWVLTALLILTFLGLCMGISLAAEDDIKFTSTLIAEETWLPPEGQADFVVELKNTGETDIERFEIITPDAMLAGEYGELEVGQTATVGVPIIFNKEGEYPVELYVVGYAGDKSLTTHTNILTITVSTEPKPTEEAVVEEQTDTPVQEPAAQTEQEEQTMQPNNEPSPVIAEETEQPVKQEGDCQDERTTLYIIIGALGVLLLIIVIIIFGILNKNRHRD